MASTSILEEISTWKLDAKFENSSRYFFATDDANSLLTGKKSYLIGRKGSGKTSIAYHVLAQKQYDTFVEKLSFKSFPFEKLYIHEDKNFTTRSRFISLWKYYIYISVLKLMLKNNSIDESIKNKIKRLFPENVSKRADNVSLFDNLEFSLNIFELVGIKYKPEENNIHWIDSLYAIEDFLIENIDDLKYYIVFDELDDDYNDITVNKKQKIRYFSLLSGLFKAVQDIRSLFFEKKLFPIICLRDDIYSLIDDSEKTKWDDFAVYLRWDEQKLKRLLAFRISRSRQPYFKSYSFNQMWDHILTGRYTTSGRQDKEFLDIKIGSTLNNFKYIRSYTQDRPRDYVKFLQVMSNISVERGSREKINAESLFDSTAIYSEYLLSEFKGEVSTIIPEINEVLEMIRQSHNSVFSYEEFLDAHHKWFKGKKISFTPERLIDLLYIFNFVGTRVHKIVIYGYMMKGGFNKELPLVIHRGFRKALGIKVYNKIDEDGSYEVATE